MMPSNQRILEIFLTLLQGQRITQQELMDNYNISKRTAHRDISMIRESLTHLDFADTLDYDPKHNTYKLTSRDQLSSQEVLVLGKILLESRALPKKEIQEFIDKLLELLSTEAQPWVKKMFANELLPYVPLQHQQLIANRVAKFCEYIRTQTVFDYTYMKNRGQIIHRRGLPVSLYFSEYYFYIVTYCPDTNRYLNLRLDRFITFSKSDKKVQILYKDRLQDGQLREKLYYMYPGKETTFTFRFWGIVEAALDKLPNSRVIQKFEDESVVIEATAFDTGVIMWLLSQGSNVQVLSPPSFLEKITSELEQMCRRYEN